jgi:hypothetical protein
MRHRDRRPAGKDRLDDPAGRFGVVLFWWCALGVVLAVVYMVTYTLLRTSGDGRRWTARLRHPKGDPPPSGGAAGTR